MQLYVKMSVDKMSGALPSRYEFEEKLKTCCEKEAKYKSKRCVVMKEKNMVICYKNYEKEILEK
jgi:hypothetical protein